MSGDGGVEGGGGPGLDLAGALYAACQRALPSSFREAHGAEMRELFGWRLRRAVDRGGLRAGIRHGVLEMTDLMAAGIGLRIRRGWEWLRRHRVPTRGAVFALVLLLYAALDDITTGNQPDYALEWTAVVLITIALAGFWIGRRRGESGEKVAGSGS